MNYPIWCSSSTSRRERCRWCSSSTPHHPPPTDDAASPTPN
jgi:hypothetical protein